MVVGGCYSGLSGHKSKKVTSSQDDGFAGELEIQLVGYAANTKKIDIFRFFLRFSDPVEEGSAK